MARGNPDIKKLGEKYHFSSDNQPKRRRGPSLMKGVKDKLFGEEEYIRFKKVEVLDENGNPTGQYVNGRVKILTADSIEAHYILRAKKSDTILKHIIEMIDGKPKQSVDMNVNENLEDLSSQFTDEELEALQESASKLIIEDE